MLEDPVVLTQLLCVIAVGAFIGELKRTAQKQFRAPWTLFVARYLAIAFLSLVVSYTTYTLSYNLGLSLCLGATLSY